ncbi:alpha/beta hydrolase [Schaalia sp. 19OD2882]|uniref:alpha/beta hydrolase n=1 Tax=Schaalia sp. 19OD2882 TaxID=2794089 RepID=UPI001C1E9859|nr:alpha/beta hydrolase [Schaalia sp. 19OD2882]QWW19486.1 alpha/beta hydrolase [Schaalia sp. 19OD2882]
MAARKRRRSPFYASRRVPHTVHPVQARLRMSPLLPSIVLAVGANLLAESPLLPEGLRARVRNRVGELSSEVSQRSQRLFFDDPGLDTLLIRGVSRLGARISIGARLWLRATIALGQDHDGRASTMIPLVPRRGYDSVMTWMLTAGTAVGQIRGGRVHSKAFYDSGPTCEPAPTEGRKGEHSPRLTSPHPAEPGTQGEVRPADSPGEVAQSVIPSDTPHWSNTSSSSLGEALRNSRDPADGWLPVPEGHPKPQMRRLAAPQTLGDLAADIDDLYWALSHGQPVKVVRVGTPDQRRWLVALPGTEHFDAPSTPNPADTETNIRESLGLPSAMRVGLVSAIHDAMDLDGVPPGQRHKEPVLICGHSQGGMIAVGLAADLPEVAGVDVQAILAMGAPARRFRIRPDVTMVAVEHDQDVIPSFDGSPARAPDHRIVVGRRLVRPRRDPLYYAHSSSTYTETVKQLERKVDVAPWGRLASAVERLRSFLPRDGEPTRVTVHDVWQELLDPTTGDTWDTFIRLDRGGAEPVAMNTEWMPAWALVRPLAQVGAGAGVDEGEDGGVDGDDADGGAK